MLYPGLYGMVTAGGDKDYPVDYSHLNINGYVNCYKEQGGRLTGDAEEYVTDKLGIKTIEIKWSQGAKRSRR